MQNASPTLNPHHVCPPHSVEVSANDTVRRSCAPGALHALNPDPMCIPPLQEGQAFAEAASLDAHKGLVHIFFAQRSTKKVRGVTDVGRWAGWRTPGRARGEAVGPRVFVCFEGPERLPHDTEAYTLDPGP